MSWSEEAQAQLPEPPYVARYTRGDKRLSYLASTHENRAPNPVFEMIDQEAEVLSPQVIVIEGIGRHLGLSPAGFATDCARDRETGTWVNGEAMYAACLAHDHGIAFTGAEPSPTQFLAALPGSGYDVRDLLYYYVVRQIGQWKRSGEAEGRSFEELFTEFIGIWAPPYGQAASAFSVADFEGWYRERNGEEFDFAAISTDVSAPVDSPDALYTQRISHFVDIVRNTAIVRTIADMLTRFDRVLVVYGAGHHVQQHLVLEEMLGPPARKTSASGVPGYRLRIRQKNATCIPAPIVASSANTASPLRCPPSPERKTCISP